MAILTVGSGKEYSSLSAAVAASHDGDVIQVQAGTYTNDFSTISTSITIEGVGGMVHLVATEAPPNEKGILVVGTATSNPTVTLDNLEISGAAISAAEGGNGAGIRYQSGNLTINDSYIHNNQDGLLSNADTSGSITINDSEFADNGTTSGLTHNIYVGEIGNFTITGSYITAANTGNEIQSRALVNTITGNRIVDGPTATASYSINLPNGGVDVVSNNIIEQGPHSQNSNIIGFGAAGSLYAGSSLSIANNTIVNDEHVGSARAIINFSSTSVSFTNNSVYGLTSAQIATGPVSVSGTTYLTTEPTISTAAPYQILNSGVVSTAALSAQLAAEATKTTMTAIASDATTSTAAQPSTAGDSLADPLTSAGGATVADILGGKGAASAGAGTFDPSFHAGAAWMPTLHDHAALFALPNQTS